MTLVPNETEQALNRQYDVYAAAREEYRKKIDEQAARIERLEAALRPFADESIFSGPQHEYVTVKRSDCDIALAALEGKPNE